jgi:hypothetical protein
MDTGATVTKSIIVWYLWTAGGHEIDHAIVNNVDHGGDVPGVICVLAPGITSLQSLSGIGTPIFSRTLAGQRHLGRGIL